MSGRRFIDSPVPAPSQDGGPAFPTAAAASQAMGDGIVAFDGQQDGMSMRDYFAAHAPALPQHVREAFVGRRQGEIDLADFAAVSARWSWLYADAMLKTRTAIRRAR